MCRPIRGEIPAFNLASGNSVNAKTLAKVKKQGVFYTLQLLLGNIKSTLWFATN